MWQPRENEVAVWPAWHGVPCFWPRRPSRRVGIPFVPRRLRRVPWQKGATRTSRAGAWGAAAASSWPRRAR
eukprot:11164974-Lingulodinium_polyedra.AAC.1